MVVVDNPVQTKLRADAKAKEEEIRADTTTPAASLAKLTEAVMAQVKKDEDLSRAVRDSMASRGGGMWLVRPTPGLPSMRSSWRAKWNGDQSLTILSKIFLMTKPPQKKKKQTGAFEPQKKRGWVLASSLFFPFHPYHYFAQYMSNSTRRWGGYSRGASHCSKVGGGQPK